jgi:hypothetical protein
MLYGVNDQCIYIVDIEKLMESLEAGAIEEIGGLA